MSFWKSEFLLFGRYLGWDCEVFFFEVSLKSEFLFDSNREVFIGLNVANFF